MDALKNHNTSNLSKILKKLRKSSYLAAIAQSLKQNETTIHNELNKTIINTVSAFSESANPELLPDMDQHGALHTSEIIELLAGKPVGDFQFVIEHAHRRAEQKFPLEATLHAYRCGHKVFSHWMREAALKNIASHKNSEPIIADIADFALEYTDTISTIATSEYVSQTRLLADVAMDQRTELFNILLEGYDESDGRVAKILRDAGYLTRRQSFCIAVAQSVDPTEMLNLSRARRMADYIDKLLHNTSVRRLIDIRNNKVVILFSANRRASGWTAPNTSLANQIAKKLLMVGNAACIGVSNDVPATAQIPLAYKEAQLALELTDVTQRVIQFSSISMQKLMLKLAGESLQRVLPVWTKNYLQADAKQNGALSETIKMYADCNMNVLQTAERLKTHPNTIYSRLHKIYDITTLDAKKYHDLTELNIIIDSKITK